MIKTLAGQLIYTFKKMIISTLYKGVSLEKHVIIRGKSIIKAYDNSKIVIRNNVSIGSNSYIVAISGGKVDIQSNVYINRNVTIVSREHVIIGEGSLFGPNVTIYDHDHRFDYLHIYNDFKTSPVVIENDCWIGTGAIILKGTQIGAHSIIGSGAVIKGTIPPHSIVKTGKNYTIEEIKNG